MLKRGFHLAGLSALMLLSTGLVGDMSALAKDTATAIFAGGCFWSVQSDIDHAPGVVKTTTGYIGGTADHPTYEQVGSDTTGYREAVKVEFAVFFVSSRAEGPAAGHFGWPHIGARSHCGRADFGCRRKAG